MVQHPESIFTFISTWILDTGCECNLSLRDVLRPVLKAEVGDFASANSSSVLGQGKEFYFLGGEQLSF